VINSHRDNRNQYRNIPKSQNPIRDRDRNLKPWSWFYQCE